MRTKKDHEKQIEFTRAEETLEIKPIRKVYEKCHANLWKWDIIRGFTIEGVPLIAAGKVLAAENVTSVDQ